MNEHKIVIRKAQEGDNDLLAELGRTTFKDTFGDVNTPEDMELYLSISFSPEIQLAELKNYGCTILLIYCDNRPAGYARLQAGNTDVCITGERPVELVRFYLESQWIGKGVASHLMEACINNASENGYDVIWLGVWKENPRAISFYRKSGFVEVGEHTFLLGNDPQVDAVMARKLI